MNTNTLPRNNPIGRMLITCCILFWTIMSPHAVRAQQTLNYVLLPDSTITPTSGGIPIGPSEQLTGSFSWIQYTPSLNQDVYTFYVTALNFQAPGYSLSLADGAQPDSTTPSDPNGQTDMNADVNWAGGPPGPYFIGGFAEGTYTGPATAPTGLEMTEGFVVATGGNWQDYLYIDAVVVPEPPATLLGLIAFGALCALCMVRSALIPK